MATEIAKQLLRERREEVRSNNRERRAELRTPTPTKPPKTNLQTAAEKAADEALITHRDNCADCSEAYDAVGCAASPEAAAAALDGLCDVGERLLGDYISIAQDGTIQ